MDVDIEITSKNLTLRGFSVQHFSTSKEACDWLCSEVKDTTVGFGGSMTVQKLGLYERLADNNVVFWHWICDDRKATEIAAAHANVYILSANSIAQSGEIVNIDGNGNRIASAFYGHDRVIFVVGINKLAESLQAAIDRARNIASPLNARRLKRKTPCVDIEPMKCHNCSSPERICSGMSILMERMGSIPKMDVIIIDEILGY